MVLWFVDFVIIFDLNVNLSLELVVVSVFDGMVEVRDSFSGVLISVVFFDICFLLSKLCVLFDENINGMFELVVFEIY